MSPSSIIYDSKQLASFSYCQWLTMQTLASTSLQGALQLWDVRQPYVRIPASQTLTLSKLIGQCQPLTCLAGFPGQPHIVTSGDAGGRIVSWDLRSDREPMFIAHADGNITGLRYSSTSARLWMTTLSGTIGIVEEKVVHTVFKEPIAGITDFCVPDCATPSELYALNDQKALIFLANAF